ncbi:MAG: hypothetical protein OQK12_07925 [Motiliproteus sp.]|nr:hypothetical protein [Motiliproteus sp.]
MTAFFDRMGNFPKRWLIHLLMLFTSVFAGYWLWLQPDQLASDDALFFARGVTDFSVLEFSPHFPGYPVYIGFAKLLNVVLNDPVASIMSVGRISVLLLPWLSYGLLRQLGCSPASALAAFLLILLDPLLLGIGVQGLSDGPALCILSASVWLLAAKRWLCSGLVLGLCIAVRPSYLPILLPLLAFIPWRYPPSIKPLLYSFFSVGIVCLGFLISKDGFGYFVEGWRFVIGHFQTWGNSALGETQQIGWPQSLANYYSGRFISGAAFSGLYLLLPLLPVFLMVLSTSTIRKKPESTILLLLFTSALIWTLLAQNPDNLRHLAPVLWPSYCLAAIAIHRLFQLDQAWLLTVLRITMTGLIVLQLSFATTKLTWVASPPIQQAKSWLQKSTENQSKHTVVATNRGVALLREQLLGVSVMDSFYSGTVERVLSAGGVRLSTSNIENKQLKLVTQFTARNPAEKTLLGYQAIPPAELVKNH